MKRILITHEVQTVRQARQSNVMSIKVKKKTGACLLQQFFVTPFAEANHTMKA